MVILISTSVFGFICMNLISHNCYVCSVSLAIVSGKHCVLIAIILTVVTECLPVDFQCMIKTLQVNPFHLWPD